MAKTPKPNLPPAAPTQLHVTGPAKGRWRCGLWFGPEVNVLEIADLTEAEIEALAADPELTVTEVAAAEPVPAPIAVAAAVPDPAPQA